MTTKNKNAKAASALIGSALASLTADIPPQKIVGREIPPNPLGLPQSTKEEAK